MHAVEQLLLLYAVTAGVSVTTDIVRSCSFAYRRKAAPCSEPPYYMHGYVHETFEPAIVTSLSVRQSCQVQQSHVHV